MPLPLLLLALLPLLATRPGLPPQEPDPAPAPEEPPAPAARERPAVTRERLRNQLALIAEAARQLARLAEEDGDAEQVGLARRIAWLAGQMHADLEVGTTPGNGADPAAPAGPAPEPPSGEATGPDTQEATAPDEDAPEAAEPRGERADPTRWRPVRPSRVVRTRWGTNIQQASEAAGGRRSFVGEHHLAVSAGAAVMSTFYRPHRDFTFRECIFEGAPGEDGRVTTRWGFRAYDVIDWRFLHCEWRNIPDEHGCYLSAPGSVLWSQCRFEGIGSQAIQVVYRWDPEHAHETSDPSLRNLGGLQHVSECLFLECGKPTGGRPSYALSFFEGPRCDVRIERSYIQTLESHHLDHLGQPSSSYGAIMVHDRPRVEILDTYVRYRRPDRPVIQIWNVEEVVIQGCEVVEGEIELRNCRRVRLIGNSGGARVTVGTGPAYVWPMPHVRYEGPIGGDYSQ